MPTRRGYACAAVGLLLVLAGRLLGLVELYVIGTAALALVLSSLALVRLTRLDVDVRRSVTPRRVQAGGSARVELAVTNLARTFSPLIEASDHLGAYGTSPPALLVPLQPGQPTRVTYVVPLAHRGVFAIGPLQLRLEDPFGLAASTRPFGARTNIRVAPRREMLPAPARRGLAASGSVGSPRAAPADIAVDLNGLRPYVPGDDIRRMHWPSTARHDELIVRQREPTTSDRTTVAIDVRRGAHDARSLEDLLSAAASLAAAAARDGQATRLVSTGGVDTWFGQGPDHLNRLMDRLAEAGTGQDAGIGWLVSRLHVETQGSVTLLCTARASGSDLSPLASLAGHGERLTVVRLGGAAPDPARRGLPFRVCDLGEGDSFADTWKRALSSWPPTPRTI